MEFFEKLIANRTTIAEALTRIAASLDVIQINIQYFAETAIEERDERLALAHGTNPISGEKATRSRSTKAELAAKREAAVQALRAAGVDVDALVKKWDKLVSSWDSARCDKAFAIAADAAAKADAEAEEAGPLADDVAPADPEKVKAAQAAKPSLPEAEKLADAYVRTFTDHVHGAAELSAALKGKYGIDHLDGFTEAGLQGVIGFIRGLLAAKAGDPAKAVAAAAEAKPAPEMTPDEIKALRERVRAACAEHAKGEGGPEATKKILREVGGKASLLEVEPANLLEMLAVLTGQKAA